MDKIRIFKTRQVKTPQRGTSKSAGIDFFVPEDFKKISILPGEDINIPSGIKTRLPEGHALVANNKSGIATKRKLVFGASVVDEDYTGEIHLHMINVGRFAQSIEPGDKIVQFLLEKQNYADVEVVDSEESLFEGVLTERGAGAFGSTDKK